MELWFTEDQTSGYRVSYRVRETLHREKTRFQDLAILDTAEYGRALVLDGIMQTAVKDEYIYHEMITHVGLFTHPQPRRVLVIGGGDGGVVREALRHPAVQQIDLVEIDEAVVRACRQYLPEIAGRLGDERVNIVIEDGIKYVLTVHDCYDVAIVDAPDPVGPAAGLFEHPFYAGLRRALKPDGLLVAQTESPFFNQDIVRRTHASLFKLFKVTRLYLACIPIFPGGLWTFTLASHQHDPLKVEPRGDLIRSMGLQYYNRDVHHGAFALPEFMKRIIY